MLLGKVICINHLLSSRCYCIFINQKFYVISGVYKIPKVLRDNSGITCFGIGGNGIRQGFINIVYSKDLIYK